MDDTTTRTMFPPDLEHTGSRDVPVPLRPLPQAPGHEAHPDLIAENTGARGAGDAGDELRADGEPPTQMTYATRLPPDHPGLQLEKPQARSLRRGPILLIGGALTAAVLLAAAVAFSPRSQQAHAATAPDTDSQTKGVPIPEAVENAPGNNADLHPQPPKLGKPLHGADLPDDQAPTAERRGAGSFGHSSLRETIRDERQKAVGSSILVDIEGSGTDTLGGAAANAAAALLAGTGAPGTAKADSPQQLPLGGAGTGDPNMQQHKSDFLARDGVNTATYLNQPVIMPRSPFEVKAGTIIPTTLLTPINSDLPGTIIGQVRENVYDTVSGNYLIIPQGSKLLATYDSAVSYGQERVLLCWNRVIRPDGISISLECMPGADLAGASGIADEVNHHWWRIITGVALGTLLSATAERAAGNPSGYQPTIAQGWAANAGGAVNTAGQQITQKNLAIQPTITVRAGYSVNVIVTKDIVFPPYTNQGGPR
ncbi:MAG TPA: TrbI/VirB10 family protein [Polyangia bacterium]|nr:TrbI/VirB10 family protein [Polyangia bacterium]